MNNNRMKFISLCFEIVCFISILYLVCFLFSGEKHLGDELVKEKAIVYSVDTQKGIQGSFALGYGGINSDVKYYVYQDQGAKGKLLKSYDTDRTYIKDELKQENDSYIVTEYKVSYDVPFHFLWIFSKGLNSSNITKYKGKECFETKEFVSNTLYIPKGYVKKQIDLNIK